MQTSLWAASVAAAASCAVLGWQIRPAETAAFAVAAAAVVGLRLLQARWERVGDPIPGRGKRPSALFQQHVLIPVEAKSRRTPPRRADRR